MNQGEFMNIAYGFLLVLVAYLTVKGFLDSKKVGENPRKFKAKPRIGVVVISVVLVVMGALEGLTFIGVAMVVMGVFFLMQGAQKPVIGENGIFFSGKFDPWTSIQKWQFDKSASELILRVKENGREDSRRIKIHPDDLNEMNQVIREYKKSGKSKAK